MPIIHLEDGVPPSKSRLILVGATYTTTVAAGGTLIKEFAPPPGKIWEVHYISLDARPPAGAATGTHQFRVFIRSSSVMLGKSVFGSAVEWDNNMWVTADSVKQPATETGAMTAVRNMVCDSVNNLTIRYDNNTDVVNSGDFIIFVYVKETPII